MPTVQEIMTPEPCTIAPDAPVVEAARLMREEDVGDVIVVDGTEVVGIVTDRDIAVRAVAAGADPASTRVRDICSSDPRTVSPDDDLDEAVQVMRESAVRRLPVVSGGRPVGILSIGDVAIQQDPGSALADISSEPPNT